MEEFDVAPLAEFNPEIGLLVASLDDGTREWRDELCGNPKWDSGFVEPSLDAITWRPFPNGPSIGTLILHSIECELAWFEKVAARLEVSQERFDRLLSSQIDVDAVQWPDAPREPIGWYFELADEQRKRSKEVLSTLDDSSLVRVNRTETASYSIRWIVSHVVQHEAYHGGQAVLLKAMFDRL